MSSSHPPLSSFSLNQKLKVKVKPGGVHGVCAVRLLMYLTLDFEFYFERKPPWMSHYV